MTGSVSAEASRGAALRLSARVWLPTLALLVYLGGGVVPSRAQEASPSLPDSAVREVSTRDPDRYGPVTDSLLRARCEGLPIRRVEVRCLDIFDPVPAGRMSGF